MREALVTFGMSMGLAACTASPEVPAASATREPTAPSATVSVDAPLPDQCRAAERQSWVGWSVDSLPAASHGENRRVVCTTCARTEDYRPDRLNIEFDAGTRRVVKVGCG
jgi:hypothetical protein